MRSLAFGLVILAGCAQAPSSGGPPEATKSLGLALGGVPVGDIRGATEITDSLRDRLFDRSFRHAEQFEIERVAGVSVYGLRVHLGQFAPSASVSNYQGGDPNAFGMVLWHQVSVRFGQGMAALCEPDAGVGGANTAKFADYARETDVVTGMGGQTGGSPGGANPPFEVAVFPSTAQVVRAVCALSGNAEKREVALGALFDEVMGYGGSLADERQAFVTAFGADGSPFVAMSPEDRVAAAFEALILNPQFLLEN